MVCFRVVWELGVASDLESNICKSVSDTDQPKPFEELQDPDRADQSYRRLRSKLTYYFVRRGCPDAEDLADEVIARAWRRYSKGANITTEILPYCFGIAVKVLQEKKRRRVEAQIPDGMEGIIAAPDCSTEELETALAVEECLRRLDPAEAAILMEYYQGDRKALARKLGVTANALRIRVSRDNSVIREDMERTESARRVRK